MSIPPDPHATLDQQARLRELGLWPVWQLRLTDAVTENAAIVEAAAENGDNHVMAARGKVSDAEFPTESRTDAGLTITAAGGSASCPVFEDHHIAQLDWPGLQHAVNACTRCDLHQSRTQGVLGVGDVHADWLIIGEAPGAEEDRQGQPFVGQAGKLLDAMLAAIGQVRGKNVYIANVLKSRPPGNRDPLPAEVAACAPYLQRQIALINPKIILALGRFAAQSLLSTDTSISKLRGQVHAYQGVPLVVTYHPAYLLRNPADKAKVWDDLVLARRTLAAQ